LIGCTNLHSGRKAEAPGQRTTGRTSAHCGSPRVNEARAVDHRLRQGDRMMSPSYPLAVSAPITLLYWVEGGSSIGVPLICLKPAYSLCRQNAGRGRIAGPLRTGVRSRLRGRLRGVRSWLDRTWPDPRTRSGCRLRRSPAGAGHSATRTIHSCSGPRNPAHLCLW